MGDVGARCGFIGQMTDLPRIGGRILLCEGFENGS